MNDQQLIQHTQQQNQLLSQMLSHMRTADAPQLWDAGDCAAWMKLSRDRFLRDVACKPNFPNPHTPTGGSKARVWYAKDVQEWFRLNAKAKAQ